MLLGLVGAVALGGSAAATPPGPLSEGRESDPVARDFHMSELTDSALRSRATEGPTDRTPFWAVLSEVIEEGMHDYTIPLGTVPMNRAQ